MMQTTPFTPCFISKQQLAQRYFPQANHHTAIRHLRRWILRDKALCEALSTYHLSHRSKHFTRQQVTLIYEHLGEP